jgi:hypothetical protein
MAFSDRPSMDDLTERIRALPGVEYQLADAESGAPEVSWGERFFFAGADRRRPFATIVPHDIPGFEEDSRLDRPGVFRLNIEVGRAEFERLFGFPPAAFAEHKAGFDFTVLDRLLPHPTYALHGWVGILNPGPERLPEVDRLLARARARRSGEDRGDRPVPRT